MKTLSNTSSSSLSTLRWAAMRAILVLHSLGGTNSQDSVHKQQFLKRKESRSWESNRWNFANYQPDGLPLGQAGWQWSLTSYLHSKHHFPAPSSKEGCRRPVLGVCVLPCLTYGACIDVILFLRSTVCLKLWRHDREASLTAFSECVLELSFLAFWLFWKPKTNSKQERRHDDRL